MAHDCGPPVYPTTKLSLWVRRYPCACRLGSSLARSSDLGTMRVGVSLASFLSGSISILILLVGSNVPPRPPCVLFALSDVGAVLEHYMGPAGFVGFGLGLFGAGISSALTIPIGTTLAIEDLFGLRATGADIAESGGSPTKSLASADSAATAEDAVPRHTLRPMQTQQRQCAPTPGGRECQGASRWEAWGRSAFIVVFLALSLIPSLLQLPTIAIIMTAQVANGILLPCVASVLFISLNDASLMQAAQPQAAAANLIMFPCISVALFLASVVLLKKLVGAMGGVSDGTVHAAITAAFPVTVVCTLAVGGCAWAVRDGGMWHRRRRGATRPMVRTTEMRSVMASESRSTAAQPPC
mmetsp:Transcript_22816/g.58034  ORF Transcript_22816/g.58034 Transcript_22816/m.58034 type:complete len:355 (-) Transcript_22816:331-1395(-)